MNKQDLEHHFESNQKSFIENWKQFLSFQSVSTDSAFEQECLNCATWLEQFLATIGFEVEQLSTPGKPVVYAQRLIDESKPTVLFYGHYDVQPPDPLELWETPPFEPQIRDGKMYARGAMDNKGQVIFVLSAIETLIKYDALSCNLKIILEGEEEMGSGGIAEAMSAWVDKLKADTLMVADTGMVPSGAPTITMGLRGIASMEIELSGPNSDLHSGVFGGIVQNPAHSICSLINSFHNKDGSVAIEGFYDGVSATDKKTKELLESVPFESQWLEALTGTTASGGEKDFSVWERGGLRPTLEVNGLWSGYTGEGDKTIIPSKAGAKITLRTVVGQNAPSLVEKVKAHCEKYLQDGVRLTFECREDGGGALLLDSHSPMIEKVVPILDSLTSHKTAYRWEGGSIPIVAKLSQLAGAEPLLVGFGMSEDAMHAPNESFALDRFKLGYLYAGMFLSL